MPGPIHVVAQLQGVAKSYVGRSVLRNFDLTLEAGAVVALLGPNGAGKSTVAGVMTGRFAVEAGTVSLFGRDPRDREARARLGVMLQAAGLPDTLTVAETLALHGGYFQRRLPLEAVLSQAGLVDLAARRCDQLSGGEKRRVQFGVAIAGRPDLLVLDEPTTGFDPEARRSLWRTVREKADAGAAVLLATHHLDEAEALADRVVVLAGGQIIADGTPAMIKSTVAATMIRVRSLVGLSVLRSLPGVTRVDSRGAETTLLTTHPRSTLEALFQTDGLLADFEVTGASLEDALVDLVATNRQEAV